MKRKKSKSIKKPEKSNARIFIIFLVLLVVIIFGVNNVFFNEKNVNYRPKSDYKAPCNTKFGGIEIEGLCYDCGASDGVCPEDFFTTGRTCKIEDPDCS